jgi:TPR repeat protein
MKVKIVIFALLGLAASVASSSAQRPADIFNAFRGIIPPPNRAEAEWRKLAPAEINCIDQLLRRQRNSVQRLIQLGIFPSAPQLSSYRQSCSQQVAQQDLYQKAAQGNADAQVNLGLMYAEGRGVPKDDAQAVGWFRRAADQGNAVGQKNLAVMYFNGRGVPKDDTQAFAWFSKAAEQGNPDAQNNLALMYAEGRAVPKDDSKAIAWYRKAADQGNEIAKRNLAAVIENGRGFSANPNSSAVSPEIELGIGLLGFSELNPAT